MSRPEISTCVAAMNYLRLVYRPVIRTRSLNRSNVGPGFKLGWGSPHVVGFLFNGGLGVPLPSIRANIAKTIRYLEQIAVTSELANR